MRLNKITLQASDIGSLYEFYKEAIGLPVFFSHNNTILIKAGATDLRFEEAAAGIFPYYHFAFEISPDKFEMAFTRLQEKISLLWIEDYKSLVADFTNWKAKSFYFYDPAGNVAEIICRYDRTNSEFVKVNTPLFYNISELGIVFSAKVFEKETGEFMERFSLPFFEKQLPSSHFKVAGNEEGLIIMVPENRTWYPTSDKVSRIYPVNVSFENEGIHYEWNSRIY